MGWSVILARVAARSGVALWRHRIAVLLVALIVSALGIYEFGYAGPTLPTSSGGDCADTAMAAMTRGDPDTAHAAYACLGSPMRNTSEEAFVSNMRAPDSGPLQVNRIGDQRAKDGSRIVFFAVEQQDTAVGYIVYLDPAGKIIRVE
jgi:hypothetical protein